MFRTSRAWKPPRPLPSEAKQSESTEFPTAARVPPLAAERASANSCACLLRRCSPRPRPERPPDTPDSELCGNLQVSNTETTAVPQQDQPKSLCPIATSLQRAHK